jgi:type 1 glutamine amidotransferase
MRKDIVLLVGEKSHAPGYHEYEKDLTLLKACLEQSTLADQVNCKLCRNGWPEFASVLENASAIVLFSDGCDHDEKRHPFLVGERLQIIERHMKRGCGLVLQHYATFFPHRFQNYVFDWTGGYFDYETGSGPRRWYSKIKTDTTTPTIAAPDHPVLTGVTPFKIQEEYYYNIRFNDPDPALTPLLRTTIQDEPGEYTVAWTRRRANGGRSFATTMGHYHANLAIDGFRIMLANAIAWTAGLDIPEGGIGAILPAGWTFN